MRRVWIVAVVALAGTAGAAAKTPADTKPAAVIQKIEDCRTITADAERLACYDAAARGLAEATAKKDIVVLDREAVQQTRRGLFGFTLPHLPFFGSGHDKHGNDDEKDQIKSIDTTVKTASAQGDKWRMVMDDDSVWVTTEPLPSHDPKPGSKVHIERGALGNFFLRIESGRTVRAMRIG